MSHNISAFLFFQSVPRAFPVSQAPWAPLDPLVRPATGTRDPPAPPAPPGARAVLRLANPEPPGAPGNQEATGPQASRVRPGPTEPWAPEGRQGPPGSRDPLG